MSSEQTKTSTPIESQLQVAMNNLLETNQKQLPYQIPDDIPGIFTQEFSLTDIADWFSYEGSLHQNL